MSFVVQFTPDENTSYPYRSLTVGNHYAVEEDEDYVEPCLFEEGGTVTVWDDNGELAEILSTDYIIVEEMDWFDVLPKKRKMPVV